MIYAYVEYVYMILYVLHNMYILYMQNYMYLVVHCVNYCNTCMIHRYTQTHRSNEMSRL